MQLGNNKNWNSQKFSLNKVEILKFDLNMDSRKEIFFCILSSVF